MDARNPSLPGAATVPAWRLGQRLLPDYNRKAASYWWTMVLLGAAVVALALAELAELPAETVGHVAALSALAVAAGFFPIEIPRSKNAFVAGDLFLYLLYLLYGLPAAVVGAAAESFVGSMRSSRRWSSRIASPALSAVAMTLAGGAVGAARAVGGLTAAPVGAMVPLLALALAVLYFGANSLLVQAVVLLKRNQALDLRAFAASFAPVALAFCGNALIASLLVVAVQSSGYAVLFGALPVVIALVVIVHHVLRQQRVEGELRRARVESAEREAEQAARHVEELRASERRFHSAFTHASIGMALVATDGLILQANDALARLLGLRAADALAGQRFGAHVVSEDLPALLRELARIHSHAKRSFATELRCFHPESGALWVALNGGWFTEPASDAPCLILQVQDISARRSAEAQLHHIAFHDALTALPNRRQFNAVLADALARANQDSAQHFALMFLDFDRFKLINDSMGHSAGDQFLVQVSRRIQECVGNSGVVARLGGDEFAVLLRPIEAESNATQLAERLQLAFKQPFTVFGLSVSTSASIGITFSWRGYELAEHLLRDADIAMYRAKAAGKARHAVFTSHLHGEVNERLRLEADLRQALAEGRIDVAYQPLFNLATGELGGFESLARWHHPEQGSISPAAFIPIAEDSGLIVELTDLVLQRACRQLRHWQRQSPALEGLTMNVNIAGNDLGDVRLAERVERALADSQLDPQLLRLELTESILMQRVDGAMGTLQALRRLGVGLAIDDFGTGYSSLAYLSALPIDSLKIDRSFVRGIREGSKDSEIVKAIVSLGSTLGKTVIAEGIESRAQLQQLRALGCESGQGYFLSRPLPAAEVDALLGSMALGGGTGAAFAGAAHCH
ncbi:MAG: EAL domain-containing protein [Rubrivivax sp.]